jgi:hypothetical protein
LNKASCPAASCRALTARFNLLVFRLSIYRHITPQPVFAASVKKLIKGNPRFAILTHDSFASSSLTGNEIFLHQ